MSSLSEHQRHIAEAIEKFEQQHGDEDEWNEYECQCHDILLERINREDGFEE